MKKFLNSTWSNIKPFLGDFLRFKKDDILSKLIGLFLWVSIIRILLQVLFFIILLFF